MPYTAVDVLAKILVERRIKGSTNSSGGFIVGNRPAVCFQAAPLVGLAENIRYEQKLGAATGRTRYRGVGLAFNKWFAFTKGARPVIYEQTDVAKRFLPADEWWRIVNFDMTNAAALIDWTHEREWRSPGDFEFELSKAAIIVYGGTEYEQLMNTVPLEVLKLVAGITVLVHAIA